MKKSLARILSVSAFVLGLAATAQAAEYTLRFGHFWPAQAALAAEAFQQWADSLEKASGGRIAVQFYPSETLVKAPTAYEGVKNRIADVTATVHGYTANRFPLTQVVELPGVVRSATQGSCVIQSLYDEGLIDQEYDDTHLLYMFTSGPGFIHTKKAVVRVPADLAGLRIRRPSTVVAGILQQAGAQPVGMPAPEIYQSIQRGVVDGATLPWEGVKSFRLEDQLQVHTEVPLHALAFLVTMNKSVYERMPQDLRAVIDAHSGMTWAQRAGRVFDADDIKARQAAVEQGDRIVTVEGGVDNPQWTDLLARGTEAYLSDLRKRGLDGRAVYQRALQLSSSCAQQ